MTTEKEFNLAKQVYNDGNDMLAKYDQTLSSTSNLIGQINTFGEIRNESKRLDNENLRIRGEIKNQAQKFLQNQYIIENVFSERRDTINKHFEVIDKGLREGNDELILHGLKMVGDFVTTNPFGSFNNFKKILDNDDEILMLDF